MKNKKCKKQTKDTESMTHQIEENLPKHQPSVQTSCYRGDIMSADPELCPGGRLTSDCIMSVNLKLDVI